MYNFWRRNTFEGNGFTFITEEIISLNQFKPSGTCTFWIKFLI